ncbi:MAG: FAD binding domain-containing protein [bacterium]|jgi:xanthine dehydrogenase small subunit|nr:2Fe-2S iron-sulfur cluster binding domain-containing protein [Planctomycetota bacterium]HIL51439.1 2Fe-2S iron-sulfur cluster binding domain-containing protein [Planctomycetota bacterium]
MENRSEPLRFQLNAESLETCGATGRLLLDYLRRDRRAVGTKEGCREGDCGACTVLLGELLHEGSTSWVRYRAVPACMLLLGHVRGRHVVTIEGLNTGETLSPPQRAVVERGATQCGFCTPGFVVSFTGYLLNATGYDPETAIDAIAGNLCRCTGYTALVQAARDLEPEFTKLPPPGPERTAALVQAGALPEYFTRAAAELERMQVNATQAEGLLLAGGTDLIVQQTSALDSTSPEFLLPNEEDRVPRVVDGRLVLPGACTFEDLRRSPDFLALWPGAHAALGRFASILIRERASVAGNIANASPIADGTAIFLALDAELELASPADSRRIPLKEFFLGYKQIALKEGERIAGLRMADAAHLGRLVNFEKLSKRTQLDIATVNSALSIAVVDGRIEALTLSAGGVAPIPLLLAETANFLVGRPLTAATLIEAAAVLDGEIAPISDVRGSEEYKRLAMRQLFWAHFLELFPEAIAAETFLEAIS